MNKLVILIIGLFLIMYKRTGNITNISDLQFPLLTPDNNKILYTKFVNNFKLNTTLYLPMVWALLQTESGSQIINDIPNDKVIGDNGNSVGYFQINKYGAIADYNQTFNTSYTINECKDFNLNKKIGLWYLTKCYNSALSQVNNKTATWLTYKKYNGGIDETETSNNYMAESYANKTYKQYLAIKEFYILNFGV